MTDQDRERLEKIRKNGGYEISVAGFSFLFGLIDEQDAEIERLKADFESNEQILIEIHEALDGLPMGGPSEPGAKSRPYFTAETRIKNLRAENERLKAPYNSVFECEACHALSRVSIERPVRLEKVKS